MTPEQKRELDNRFKSLEIFTYCLTCQALLLGAEDKTSFWGRKATQIASIHKTVTKHQVYVGRPKGV